MIIYATKQTLERYNVIAESVIESESGDRIYEFNQDGILHTMKINKKVNFDWLFTMKVDGKTDYFYAGEKFREFIISRYSH